MKAGRTPQKVDLDLYAGDSETFGLILSLRSEPVDTSEGQWDAQIKPEGVTEAVESFTVTLDPDVPGRMELFIDAGASQRLGTYRQPLRWDLQQIIDAANTITHAQGAVRMLDDVTRVDL